MLFSPCLLTLPYIVTMWFQYNFIWSTVKGYYCYYIEMLRYGAAIRRMVSWWCIFWRHLANTVQTVLTTGEVVCIVYVCNTIFYFRNTNSVYVNKCCWNNQKLIRSRCWRDTKHAFNTKISIEYMISKEKNNREICIWRWCHCYCLETEIYVNLPPFRDHTGHCFVATLKMYLF